MSLQTSVAMYPALGLAGQQAHLGQAVYTPADFLSDGTAKAGHFVFAAAVPSVGNVHASAQVFGYASATAESGSKVLGLVERVFSGAMAVGVAASDTYAAGEGVTIAIRGDYFIEVPATLSATVGQAVLCNPVTGAISFGNAGATNDTGWTVASAGSAGDIITITNHGLSITPAA